MNDIFLKIINLSNQIEELEGRIKNDQIEAQQLKTGMKELTDGIAGLMKKKNMHNFGVTDDKGNRFMFYQQNGELKYMSI